MCNTFRPDMSKNVRKGSEHQFPGKLHRMMEYAEREGLHSIIVWVMDGKAIMINDSERLVDLLLPKFFSQTKYRSFRRQLLFWHFNRVLDGPYRGAFIHPYFVRDNKALCSQMSRHILAKPPPPSNGCYNADDSDNQAFDFRLSNDSHIDIKNEARVCCSTASQWLKSMNRGASTENSKIPGKQKAVPSKLSSLSPTTMVGSTTVQKEENDVDLLSSFAGRSFFLIPSFECSPSVSSIDDGIVDTSDIEYFDIDEVFENDTSAASAMCRSITPPSSQITKVCTAAAVLAHCPFCTFNFLDVADKRLPALPLLFLKRLVINFRIRCWIS